jgi:hypothetical protein
MKYILEIQDTESGKAVSIGVDNLNDALKQKTISKDSVLWSFIKEAERQLTRSNT